MSTSKKPMSGARYLSPFEMNMIRIVPRLTSQTLAEKIRRGKRIYENTFDKERTFTSMISSKRT
jgi:hypothetical protein